MDTVNTMNSLWKQDEDFKKRNQHYVPQFWQKRFRNDENVVFVRYRAADDPSEHSKGVARITSTKNTMTGDWTYTVFDEKFLPYDTLENLFAVEEAKISQTEAKLLVVGAVITPDLHRELCHGIALAVCRLPTTMRRGLGETKKNIYQLALVHEMPRTEFEALTMQSGMDLLSDEEYQYLKDNTEDQLLEKTIQIDELSPQSHALPEQESLMAVKKIAPQILSLDLEIVEGATGPFFILGDQPIRGNNLNQGFSVPLSRSAAAIFKPPQGVSASLSRRMVVATEVEAINREQWDRCRTHVIGSDQAYLNSL